MEDNRHWVFNEGSLNPQGLGANAGIDQRQVRAHVARKCTQEWIVIIGKRDQRLGSSARLSGVEVWAEEDVPLCGQEERWNITWQGRRVGPKRHLGMW